MVDLTTWTISRVSTVVLNAGEKNLRTVVQKGNFGYWATWTATGQLVKVDINTNPPQRVSSLVLNSTNSYPQG